MLPLKGLDFASTKLMKQLKKMCGTTLTNPKKIWLISEPKEDFFNLLGFLIDFEEMLWHAKGQYHYSTIAKAKTIAFNLSILNE